MRPGTLFHLPERLKHLHHCLVLFSLHGVDTVLHGRDLDDPAKAHALVEQFVQAFADEPEASDVDLRLYGASSAGVFPCDVSEIWAQSKSPHRSIAAMDSFLNRGPFVAAMRMS